MLVLYNPLDSTAYEGQVLFGGMDIMSNWAGAAMPHQGPWTMHCSQQVIEQHQQQESGMLMSTSVPWEANLDQVAEQNVPKSPPSQAGSSNMETSRKRSKAGNKSEEHVSLIKQRNKEHARRSRLRQKFLLESLNGQLLGLREQNTALRQVVEQKMPDVAPQVLEECSAPPILRTQMGKAAAAQVKPRGVSGAGVLTWDCNPQLLAILERAEQARQAVRERLKTPANLSS